MHLLPHRWASARSLGMAFAAWALAVGTVRCAKAQNKGEPGRFDFYLMNVAWGPEFCSVPGAGPHCIPPRGFVLHGLWTQFDDGSYPVFCSNEPGPKNLRRNLDITPDLPLLQHEWDKHGTCSDVGPERFFAMEREAFHSLRIPVRFQHVDRGLNLPAADILAEFYKANPQALAGSLALSCSSGRLSAVEECFTRDLKPMRCEGVTSCTDRTIQVVPDAAATSR